VHWSAMAPADSLHMRGMRGMGGDTERRKKGAGGTAHQEGGGAQRGGSDVEWLLRGRHGEPGPMSCTSPWGCSCTCARGKRRGEDGC
jgi:hypothetical protein